MWTVKNVMAQNFMSFGNVEYDFQTGCTIIKAENNDDEGQESNGGGKTSFIDILPICILGQSLTGRNLKECVNWRTEDKFFTVSVELTHSDGRSAVIMRKVYNNTKSAELYINVDGVQPKGVPCAGDKVDVIPGNKWILEELLDISKDDLLGYYLISPNYYTPYFKASAKNKVEIINRFSKADKIDKVLVDLEQVKTSTLNRHDSMVAQLEGLEEQEIRLGELIKTPLDAQMPNVDPNSQALLDQIKNRVEELDHQILHFDTSEIGIAEVERDAKELEAKGVVAQVNECNNLANGLKAKLSGTLSCPKCKFEFIPAMDDDVSVLKRSLAELEEIGGDLQANQDSIKEEVLAVRKKVEDVYNQVHSIRGKLIIERDAEKVLIYPLEQEVKKMEVYNQKVAEHEGVINGYKAQLKAAKTQMSDIRNNQSINKLEVDGATQWVENFNDFKFYLANKPIKIISGQINSCLQANRSNMMVHIEGFKKLKSGAVKQQLNPIIYKNSDEGCTYDTFSGGERVKLNISADLAFQGLINSSSKSGGLNYYCNDELLNSLDSMGIGLAAEAFDAIDKTIMLVSHSGADLHYDKTVNIIKENGESKIK
jgi:DNA repair exonuclease SbcCD ATPase subunit